jgi:prolyl oligopeptidase
MSLSRCALFLPIFTSLACAGTPPVPTPAQLPTPESVLAKPRDGAPPTPLFPVSDSYHGVTVVDPYRWLEGAGPEVDAFITGQNEHARHVLDALPERARLEARLREVLSAQTVAYSSPAYVKGQLFAMKLEPPRPQRMLVAVPLGTSQRGGKVAALDNLDNERIVIDPAALDDSGKTSIDWYRVSPDGRLVAASISAGGSETGDVQVFETATGKRVHEVVPGVNGGTAGGDLAWLPDSSGFYYSRYPRGEERPAEDKFFFVQLYLHKLGTDTATDTYQLGKDFVRIAEVFVDVDDNGDVLCQVQKGDGGEFEAFLKANKPGSTWVRLTTYEDRIVQFFFGPKDTLYFVSRKDAPRGKLYRAPRAGFAIDGAKLVVPEGQDTLVSDIWDPEVLLVHAASGRLFLNYQLGGPSTIRVFDLDGKAKPGPDLLPVSSAGGLTALGNEVLFANGSFVAPNGWYRFDPASKTPATSTVKTALSMRTPVDLVAAGVTVTREVATSRDGTKVPVNILLPKGAQKGQPIPFVVTGYGGYGVNIEPAFQLLRSVLLEQGIGLAVLNLRGGGEFGEAWHMDGALTKKQNVFDDFIASLEFLVQAGYAQQGKLAITGGSNGGLLMGAVITQRPDLVAACASFVGIYDMLRVETEPNGAFNTTEFGTVTDKAQFDALYAYSPYHHVKDGTTYPPTLFIVGANDIRVAPWHSRKMVARLQAASADANPKLLVTSFGAGHGIGSSIDQVVSQNADAFAFLVHHLR